MTLDEFYDWLSERDIFHQFIENTLEQNPNVDNIDKAMKTLLQRNRKELNPISDAFTWVTSPEGFLYWEKIYEEYEKEFK